jgi:hypothetical protein
MLKQFILDSNSGKSNLSSMCNYYNKYNKNYKDNRGFLFNNADDFFIDRLNKIKLTDLIDDLKSWVKKIKTSDNPLMTHIKIINEIKKRINDLKLSNEVDWHNLPVDLSITNILYEYRECIVTILFITVSRLFKLANNGLISHKFKIKDYPVRILKSDGDAEAIIMGSLYIFSDIDVTVQSKNASTWISVLEDLWDSEKSWLDHIKWDVNYYGDFTRIGNFYIDTKYFSKNIITQMLILSVTSYFRHEGSSTFDNTILRKLINWCIDSEKLDINDDKVISTVKYKLSNIDINDRETYYKILSEAEVLESNISKKFENDEMSEELNQLLGECIIKLGEANLYRDENYILIPTVIYVVKIEQGKELEDKKCLPLYTTIANCTLGPYNYILSAIEQLGYMQHNSYKLRLNCSIKEGKYFGRFIRSIGHINNYYGRSFSEDRVYIKLIDKVTELDTLKKDRSQNKDNNIMCEFDYNLYEDLIKLFNL